MSGLPEALPSIRNWTVPVGVAVVADVPATTLAVRVSFVPATTLKEEVVSVVLEKKLLDEEGVEPMGVTRSQSLTILKASTLPQPVARSYPTVALYPIVPPLGQLRVPFVHGLLLLPVITS